TWTWDSWTPPRHDARDGVRGTGTDGRGVRPVPAAHPPAGRDLSVGWQARPAGGAPGAADAGAGTDVLQRLLRRGAGRWPGGDDQTAGRHLHERNALLPGGSAVRPPPRPGVRRVAE